MRVRARAVRGSAWLLALGLTTLIGAARAGGAEPARRVLLFTAAEAQQLRVSDTDWKQPRRSRGIASATGPRIEVKTPPLRDDSDGPILETRTPARLAINFEPNGTPVDMESLAVTARKGIFSKSLTGLLKPYVHGTSIAVDGVVIPAGKFLVDIAIADKSGAQTVQTFRLQVTE